MNRYSSYLFARPSFLEGMARAIDLGSTLQQYNDAPTPEEADYIALRSDAEAIGADMWTVLRRAASADGVDLGEAE